MRRLAVFLLSVAFAITGCGGTNRRSELPPEVATPERPASSPSGKYRLIVRREEEKGSPTEQFDVVNAHGRLEYKSTDHFHTRHTTFFLWDDQDRVWVYSGDVGTYYWAKEKGQWKKRWPGPETRRPAFLRKVRPGFA